MQLKEKILSEGKVSKSTNFWDQSPGVIGLTCIIINHIKYTLVNSKGKNIYLDISSLEKYRS